MKYNDGNSRLEWPDTLNGTIAHPHHNSCAISAPSYSLCHGSYTSKPFGFFHHFPLSVLFPRNIYHTGFLRLIFLTVLLHNSVLRHFQVVCFFRSPVVAISKTLNSSTFGEFPTYIASFCSSSISFINAFYTVTVVLYVCETWSLTLSDEHKLRLFENRAPRRIFGPKREDMAGGWTRLHNEELLYNLYASPNIMWVIKARRMR